MLNVNLIRTMRKKKLLSLYGHQNLSHALVHRLSQFQRIGKNKLVSLLMFLSVIAYLINYLRMETSSVLMPYRRLRSWSGVHIASDIILFLMQLMIAIFFVEESNRPLMKDDWKCMRCKLTRRLSLFITLIWITPRCSFGRNKPKELKEKMSSLVSQGRRMSMTRFWLGKTLGAREFLARLESACYPGTTGQTGRLYRSDRSAKKPTQNVQA